MMTQLDRSGRHLFESARDPTLCE